MVTGGSQTSHTETTLQLTKNVRIGSKMSEHFREGDGRDTTLFLINSSYCFNSMRVH